LPHTTNAAKAATPGRARHCIARGAADLKQAKRRTNELRAACLHGRLEHALLVGEERRVAILEDLAREARIRDDRHEPRGVVVFPLKGQHLAALAAERLERLLAPRLDALPLELLGRHRPGLLFGRRRTRDCRRRDGPAQLSALRRHRDERPTERRAGEHR
jgi:hypothetical protein